MDGGVVGNALEPEELVEAEAEENLKAGPLGTPLGFARNQPVERGLPAHHAIDQFLQKSSVGAAHLRTLEFGGEEVFHVIRLRLAPVENAPANFSWFLNGHTR